MTAASPGPAPATPGQAVFEAWSRAFDGLPVDDWERDLSDSERADWEGIAQGAIAHPSSHDGCAAQIAGLETDREAAREAFRKARDERDAITRHCDTVTADRDEYRDNAILHVRERDEARARLAVQHDAMTQLRAGHAEALAAVRYFAETWAELLVGMPDDYGCTMNCAEANAAADLYRALGDDGTAASILAAHAAHDTDGDQHYAGDGA